MRFPLFSLIFYIQNARYIGFALTSIVPANFFFDFFCFLTSQDMTASNSGSEKVSPQDFE